MPHTTLVIKQAIMAEGTCKWCYLKYWWNACFLQHSTVITECSGNHWVAEVTQAKVVHTT